MATFSFTSRVARMQASASVSRGTSITSGTKEVEIPSIGTKGFKYRMFGSRNIDNLRAILIDSEEAEGGTPSPLTNSSTVANIDPATGEAIVDGASTVSVTSFDPTAYDSECIYYDDNEDSNNDSMVTMDVFVNNNYRATVEFAASRIGTLFGFSLVEDINNNTPEVSLSPAGHKTYAAIGKFTDGSVYLTMENIQFVKFTPEQAAVPTPEPTEEMMPPTPEPTDVAPELFPTPEPTATDLPPEPTPTETTPEPTPTETTEVP